MVLNSPEAEPAFSTGTSASVKTPIGETISPNPAPATMNPGRNVQTEVEASAPCTANPRITAPAAQVSAPICNTLRPIFGASTATPTPAKTVVVSANGTPASPAFSTDQPSPAWR